MQASPEGNLEVIGKHGVASFELFATRPLALLQCPHPHVVRLHHAARSFHVSILAASALVRGPINRPGRWHLWRIIRQYSRCGRTRWISTSSHEDYASAFLFGLLWISARAHGIMRCVIACLIVVAWESRSTTLWVKLYFYPGNVVSHCVLFRYHYCF